jgi:hypothetical protein
MKDSPSAPTAPDPAALIGAQSEANRITSFTPLGDLRYGEVGSEGQFVPGTGGTATYIDLSPETLTSLNLEQEISRILGTQAAFRAEELPSGNVDFSGLPGFPSTLDTSGFPGVPSGIDFSGLTQLPGIGDFSADARRVEDATFQRAMGLLNPEFAQQEERLRQRLANQGIPIEAVAASGTGEGGAPLGEFTRFERGRTEALQNAAFDAVRAGRAEQSRLFGLASGARGQQFQEGLAGIDFGFRTRQQALAEALQGIDLSRTGRQQGISEDLTQRSTAFNELMVLLGGQQVQMPQFAAPQPINVLGAEGLAYDASKAQFQAQQQQQNALMSGLFGLGSTGLLAALLG